MTHAQRIYASMAGADPWQNDEVSYHEGYLQPADMEEMPPPGNISLLEPRIFLVGNTPRMSRM